MNKSTALDDVRLCVGDWRRRGARGGKRWGGRRLMVVEVHKV